MKTEIRCRSCGATLATLAEPYEKGFIMHSPVDPTEAIHIQPRGRTILRCPRCGATREWYPPPQRKRRASSFGHRASSFGGTSNHTRKGTRAGK